MNKSEARLGLDIGRVLISPGGGAGDTSFISGSLEAALATPPYDGMFEVVPRLVARFVGRAWLVSKCGPRVEDRTRRWLDHHRFFERTGIPPENLQFCRDRPAKAPICRDLGITHFVDDRRDVLEAMRGTVPRLFQFDATLATTPDWLVPLRGWADALALVHPTPAGE